MSNERPKKLTCDIGCQNCPAFGYDDCGAVILFKNNAIAEYDAWLIERLEGIRTQTKWVDRDLEIRKLINELKPEVKHEG